uniref:THAP-type domain-containing protein n=1 Tax=Salarias fasciatus TaxID=181472 RepID=A0A672HWV4_SALFA
MVRNCCVARCNAHSHDWKGKKLDNGPSFFSFPTWKQHEGPLVSNVTKRRRLAWIAAVRRVDIKFNVIPRHLLVCSRHFHSGKPAHEMDETHPDWVPTLHMGHSEVCPSKSDRHERRLQRQLQKDIMNIPEEHHHRIRTPVMETASKEVERVEVVLKMDCDFCDQSRKEINRLLEENRQLRSELNRRELNEEFLKNDTEKVRYYTGLPCFAVLLSLFINVKSFLPAANKLSPFQMLFLTLMRLRLDLPVQHLCHLFNVSHKTLSSAFSDTVDVLYARLRPLVHWPERQYQQATMPYQFVETFGKRVAIIIDCFEIRIEKPSNLKARAQTYSHYKGTHTMKYLIGITPQGSISFISKGWGGRASDKHITEKCGLLNKLLPGDVVLADRGFDIRDAVGVMCAELKIPSSTKGLYQLDAKDVEDTRAIAHLRIHVERVIGSMRNKYKILHTTIPIRLLLACEGEELTLLDKMVNVCCCLVNMCPSVVVKPKENETCCC